MAQFSKVVHSICIFPLKVIMRLQWRAEVWWCPGWLLDCMPPTKF